MDKPVSPRIAFSEWLPTGVMVHFQDGDSVFFPAEFLYEAREFQAPTRMLDETVRERE